MKFRSWAVLGAQDHYREALGCAQDGSETAKNRPRADLGAPRASQERPEVVQKRLRAEPEMDPGRTGARPEHVWRIEHHQTRLQTGFSTFLFCRAEARSLKFVRPRNVS